MKRTLYISPKNSLELCFVKDDKKATWYFVHWNNDETDEEGNYTIYTYKTTFGERIPIFKSKDWSVICNVGNMVNGMFHNYFQISDSYPLLPPLNIDCKLNPNIKKLSFWKSIKEFFV